MFEVDDEFERRFLERRLLDRRALPDRRQLAMQEEFLAAHTEYCAHLRLRLTPQGCKELRERVIPPTQCADCPGVLAERRLYQRRIGEERRMD
jgi:hypothetical protein